MTSAIARPAQHAVDKPAAALSRRRKILVWTLVVLATVLAVVAILTTWVKRQMLDDQAWKTASTKVIQDQQVQAALAAFVVNQLYDNVNVAQALEQRLPENSKSLAAPLATALRQPATNTVKALLGRPRFQQLWINATSVAHDKLVNVLENKTGHGISTGNGVVTVNLHDLVVELGTDLGLSASALEKIPADTGTVTLMSSDQLAAAQKGVRLVRVLSAFLLIAVLLLYALAIFLAHGRRREMLRNVGWSLLLVGLLVLLARRAIGNYVVDALAAPGYTGTVHRVWLIGTSILGDIGAASILYGIVAIVAAWLAAPGSLARAVRREIAPVLNRRPGVAAAILGAVYLLVVLWGPTYALRKWWGVLLFGVLLALGLIQLRRQTLAEFRPEEEGALAGALAGRAAAVGKGATVEQAASPADEIGRLAALHDSGAISDDEFARAKQLALS